MGYGKGRKTFFHLLLGVFFQLFCLVVLRFDFQDGVDELKSSIVVLKRYSWFRVLFKSG